MRKQAIFVLGLTFLFSSFVIAQTKTVTNADLEKFRQKRLEAEKDLRENYEKLGFPSPEEMKQQNEQDQKEFEELAARLRREQIARENSRQNDVIYFQDGNYPNNQDSSYTRSGFINYGRYYGTGYYNSFGNRRYTNRGNRRFKRPRGFRNKFINSLPNYVLQNHRFNQIPTRSNQRPTRRRHR